jgi:hypothetical protein
MFALLIKRLVEVWRPAPLAVSTRPKRKTTWYNITV